MTVFGLLRVKNEARWIEEVIRSILPLCEHVLVFDDHSTDGTAGICEALAAYSPAIEVIRSPFEGLDESRDKQFCLDRLIARVPYKHVSGDANSPYWVLAIDGDEVLAAGGQQIISYTLNNARGHAFKLPIHYLWNDRQHRRVDGVYESFARPSIFRLMNMAFRFQKTPWGNGANFHCSSIPQELLHHAHLMCPAPLLHLGYMDAEVRARKFAWYSKIDPGNKAEGEYLHCIQGDPGGPPAEAKLLHAGPLRIVSV
jgi:glycosyltransferase involved in cell wall biosynthesis